MGSCGPSRLHRLFTNLLRDERNRVRHPVDNESRHGVECHQAMLVTFFVPLKVPLPLMLAPVVFHRPESLGWPNDLACHVMAGQAEAGTPPLPVDGRNFVSLRFWNRSRPTPPPTEPADDAGEVAAMVTGQKPRNRLWPFRRSRPKPYSDEGVARTVVEAVTPLFLECDSSTPASAGEDDNAVSAAFDRCIEHIEEICLAYRLTKWDLYSNAVTRLSVYPAILYATRDVRAEGKYSKLSLFLANLGEQHFAISHTPLTSEETNDVMIRVSRARSGDPFMTARRSQWESDHAFLIEKDTASAVVNAAVSSEVLFNAVLQSMVWEEGDRDAQRVANWFRESLVKRLKTYYAPRLGGNWNMDDPSSALHSWKVNLQDCRNRVVHSGIIPSDSDARAALDAHHAAEEYLVNRLIEKRNAYPRTTLMLSGIQGLQRRDLFKGKIAVVANEAPPHNAWLVELRTWMDEVESKILTG